MPIVDFIQRIGGAVSGAAEKLLKFRRIVVFDADDFDVEDVTNSPIQGTTSDPGTGTEYTRVRVASRLRADAASAEAVMFAGIYSTSQLGEQSFGSRVIDPATDQAWASTATFRAGFVRGNLSGPVHVDLYRPGDTTVLATLDTSSASGVELEADVTAEVIGQPAALLVARAYSDVDTLINNMFTKMNTHFANVVSHTNADVPSALSAVTYPPAVDLSTRLARINAMCDAYELSHRILDNAAVPPVHVNAGGDATNTLSILAAATTTDEAKARALDLQAKWNAHVADGATWHAAADAANNVTGPASVSAFYAGVRFS